MPVSQPLANSNARIALMLRSRGGARIIEIGGRTIIAMLLLAALLLAWFLAATLYLALRDDAVTAWIAGERRSVHAYENRIAELRARIDQLTARQLVNQESIEDRVAGIVARQAEIESRQIVVAETGARARDAGIGALAIEPNGREFPFAGSFEARTPLPESALGFAERARPMPLEVPRLELQPPRDVRGFDSPKNRGTLERLVKEVEQRSERMERSQINALSAIAQVAGSTIAEDRRMIAATGLDIARFGLDLPAPPRAPVRAPLDLDAMPLRDVAPAAQPVSGVGGPLLPPREGSASRFESSLASAESAIRQASRSRAILAGLPLARPISHQHEQTSGFGTRLDPFTRSLALHSGIDFRAPTGTGVRATARGKVVEAGWSGGYGRMVEIDHGHGITTRYAHLSAILVKEGDIVQKGHIIGQVGSTGRSTGPHLHYEVRVDDDAEDPMRFLRAGRVLSDNK